jgi:hypothetical protein
LKEKGRLRRVVRKARKSAKGASELETVYVEAGIEVGDSVKLVRFGAEPTKEDHCRAAECHESEVTEGNDHNVNGCRLGIDRRFEQTKDGAVMYYSLTFPVSGGYRWPDVYTGGVYSLSPSCRGRSLIANSSTAGTRERMLMWTEQ